MVRGGPARRLAMATGHCSRSGRRSSSTFSRPAADPGGHDRRPAACSPPPRRGAPPSLLWALVWWVLAEPYEIDRLTADPVFVVLTPGGPGRSRPPGRVDGGAATGFCSLPVLGLRREPPSSETQHMLARLMVLALPSAWPPTNWLLARREADGAEFWPTLRHVGGFGSSSCWCRWNWRGRATTWRRGCACGCSSAWRSARFSASGGRPGAGGSRRVAGHEFAYLGLGSVVPALVLAVWSLWANFAHSGDGSGLPAPAQPLRPCPARRPQGVSAWLPRRSAARPCRCRPLPPAAVGGLGFVWFSCLAGRITHQWADVPFTAHSLWHSTPFQALLTLLWTGLAIAAMIGAARAVRRPGRAGSRCWPWWGQASWRWIWPTPAPWHGPARSSASRWCWPPLIFAPAPRRHRKGGGAVTGRPEAVAKPIPGTGGRSGGRQGDLAGLFSTTPCLKGAMHHERPLESAVDRRQSTFSASPALPASSPAVSAAPSWSGRPWATTTWRKTFSPSPPSSWLSGWCWRSPPGNLRREHLAAKAARRLNWKPCASPGQP